MPDETKDAQTPVESAPQEDLQTQLETERKARETAEEKIRDLSSRLTRTQQENAELYRYHKQTLPKINETVAKSFNETWAESPEGAVEEKVVSKVKPLEEDMVQIKAKLALANARAKLKDFDEHFEDIVMLGSKPHLAPLTWTEEGLESIYQMAKAKKLEEELRKAKENGAKETEKSRTFTEGSTPSGVSQKPKVKLTPQQMNVVRNLGITAEQYAAQMGVESE